MKILLDTNVLVAGIVTTHPQHEKCEHLLLAMSGRDHKHQWYISAHTVLEFYAAVTRLPAGHTVAPEYVSEIV